MFQLAVLLIKSTEVYRTGIIIVKSPSIVWLEVVSTVTTPVPTFFIVYKFLFPTAVGKVILVVPDTK